MEYIIFSVKGNFLLCNTFSVWYKHKQLYKIKNVVVKMKKAKTRALFRVLRNIKIKPQGVMALALAMVLVANMAIVSFPSRVSAAPVTSGRFNPGVDNPNINSTQAGGTSTFTGANCTTTCDTDPGMYPSNGAYPAYNMGIVSNGAVEQLAGQPNGAGAGDVDINGYTGTGYNNGSGIDPSWHSAEWGHLTIASGGGDPNTTIVPYGRLGVCIQPGSGTAANGYSVIPTPYFSDAAEFTGANHNYQGLEGVFFPAGYEFQAAAGNWILALGYDGSPHASMTRAVQYLQTQGVDLMGADADYRQTAVLYAFRLVTRTTNRGTTLAFGADTGALGDLGNWVSANGAEQARIKQIGEIIAATAMRSARWGTYTGAMEWFGTAPTGVGQTGTIRMRVAGADSLAAAAAKNGGGAPGAPFANTSIYGTGRPDGSGGNWNTDPGVALVNVPTPSSTNGATITPIASPTDGTAGNTTDFQGYAYFNVTLNNPGNDTLNATSGQIPDWEWDFWYGADTQDVAYPSEQFFTVNGTLALAAANLATTARSDDGDQYARPGEEIFDTIAYEGLTPGTTYTANLEWVDSTGTPIPGMTSTVDFTPATANGTIEVGPTIVADEALGMPIIAFEEVVITADGTLVAEHKDVNDTDQTIYVPELATTALSEDDDNLAQPGEELTDTIAYEGLIPGETYTANLQWVDSTGTPIPGMTATAQFTPTAGTGTVEVGPTTVVDEALGKPLVAFEEVLTADGTVIAEHKDVTDEAQTVYVPGMVTKTASSTSTVPGTMTDHITVSGLPDELEDGAVVEIVASLYYHGDSDDNNSWTCEASNAVSSYILPIDGNGEYDSPGETFSEEGYYSYNEQLRITFADGEIWNSLEHGCQVLDQSFVASNELAESGLNIMTPLGISGVVLAGSLFVLFQRRNRRSREQLLTVR